MGLFIPLRIFSGSLIGFKKTTKGKTRIRSGYKQSDDRMGENSRGKANLKRWVLSFERNVETYNECLVGGIEFQSLGAMTEKALILPRGVRAYGMDRTDESDDLVDRE